MGKVSAGNQVWVKGTGRKWEVGKDSVVVDGRGFVVCVGEKGGTIQTDTDLAYEL